MTVNGEMALILRYNTRFGSFRGALHKCGWQSHNYGQFMITMSSSKRLHRDRATPTVKIQDVMRSRPPTCLAIVLIGSRIWAFDWYQNRWPWMTLNGEHTHIKWKVIRWSMYCIDNNWPLVRIQAIATSSLCPQFVWAPATVMTVANVSLWSSTSQIVQPNASVQPCNSYDR